MKNAFLINAHQPYPFSEGKLNATLVKKAEEHFKSVGFKTQSISMTDEYDIDREIEKHQWADIIFLQTPVNWMGVPWSFKKYMDEVYSYGMDGRLCDGDGRSRKDPNLQYGSGGTLKGKKYMISMTLNAPAESFQDKDQFFFEGKSPDDLFWPTHLNFRFFGMEALPTFSCHDVMKNPNIEEDLKHFEQHLKEHFPLVT